MRILLVEENLELGHSIQRGLESYCYTIDWLTDGQQALYALTQSNESFDLAIMELSLPKINGLEIVRSLRHQKINTPILILSTEDSPENIMSALDNGADDYLPKPFDIGVLNSRILAILRRSQNLLDNTLNIGSVALKPKSHQVIVNDQAVSFSRQEFKILHKLMESQGQVISREKLTRLLYGWGDDVDSNTIEVHMHSVRKKLDSNLTIRTIRGVGYIIDR